MWQCSFCSFSSSRSFNVARHEERKHQNVSAPIINVTEPKQIELTREQPTVQSQMPFQQPLQFVENQHLGNARTGEKEEVYSDDDTLSEYSSHGKQHDFFDSDYESDWFTFEYFDPPYFPWVEYSESVSSSSEYTSSF